MANHASHAALPYPIKGARYTVLLPYLDADGDPTDPTTPDTEVSKDDGAAADCTEEVATPKNSVGMLTLTGAETDCSCLSLAAKAASGPKTTLATLYPRVLASAGTGTLSAGIAGGGTLGTLLAYDVTGCFIKTTGGTGGGGTGGANNQARRIVTYNTSTGAFTVEPNWETTPDNTTTYTVLLPEGVTLGMLRALNPTTPGRTLQVESDGMAYADTREWLGSAPNTLTSGRVDAIVGAYASGMTPLQPTTAGRTLDVTAGGCAGIDWANIEAPTTTVALSSTTVDLVTAASNRIADNVWDEATSGHVSTGSFGAANAIIRSGTLQSGSTGTTVVLDSGASSSDDFYNNQIIVILSGTGVGQSRIIEDYVGSTRTATVATWVTTPTTDDYVIRPFGAIPGASAPTAAQVADAVWDEARSGHTTAGTFGEYVNGNVTHIAGSAVSTSTAQLGVNVVNFGGAAGTFASGRPEVNTTHIAGSAVSTSAAQIGVNVVNAAGTAWNSGAITANTLAADSITAAKLAADVATEIRSVASGTADSGTTTTMVDAARTEATDDWWKGCWILFTSGTIAGQVRLITGFTASSDTITFAPATTAAVSTNTYEILPSGRVDVGAWLGTVCATPTVAGVPEVDITHTNGVAVQNQDMTIASATASTVTLPTTYSSGTSLPDDDRYQWSVLQVVSGTGEGQVILLTTAAAGAREYNVLSGTMPVTLDATSKCIVYGSWRGNLEYWRGSQPNTLTSGRVDAIVGAYASGMTPLQPTVSGRTLDVTATGAAGIDWGNLENPTTTVGLTNTTISTTQTIGSVAAGGITASSIASDAITAAKLAADVTTELRSTVSGTADSGTTTTMVDAARTEADTDYWVGSWILFTSGAITGQVRLITAFNPATDTITFAPATTQAVSTQNYEILPAAAIQVGAYLSGQVPLQPTVAGRTLDVTATGAAGIDWANVESPTTSLNLSGTTISTSQTITSVSGSVGAIAAGGITAGSIASDAITAAKLAADVTTELRSIASGTADSGTTTTMVDSARTEADTDHWAGSYVLFTSGAIAGQIRLITAFNALTDTVTFTPATTRAVSTETYEILSAAGAGADLRQWLGATPNALASGRVDASVGAMANDVVTAAAIATGAIDADAIADNAIDAGAIATGAITAAKFAAGAIDAAALASDAANEIRDAVWAKAMSELSAVPGVSGTVLEALQWCFALSRNKVTQTATTQTVFKDDTTTTLAASAHSDDGTTHTRGEWA